jgi:hypothetical protein
MNGNVGIGTWVPRALFQVNGTLTPFLVTNTGNVGMGTMNIIYFGTYPMLTAEGTSGNFFSGDSGNSTVIGASTNNTGQGFLALVNVSSNSNTAFGSEALNQTTSNGFNSAFGTFAAQNSTGINETAIGYASLFNMTSGSSNTAIGNNSGRYYTGATNLTTISASTFLGYNTQANANNDSDETVIGYNAVGSGSHTVTIGSTSVGATIFPGGNVGIGSLAPNGVLDIEGTTSAQVVFNALAASAAVNVGVGSFNPGQRIDVQGTVRTTGFTLNSGTFTSGFVLTEDSSGRGTWQAASGGGGASGWTISGNNVYETSQGNVGIGTTAVNQGALVVMNGNVGIGTLAPKGLLDVQGTAGHLYVGVNGYVGLGTTNPQSSLDITNGDVGIGTWSPSALLQINGSLNPFIVTSSGNVGVGSVTPGQKLDVVGTMRLISGTTGAVLCLTSDGTVGHCTAGASCLTTCTCTCTAN